MKKHFSAFLFVFAILFFFSTSAQAQRIRFNLGGAKFASGGGGLSLTITVDATTPTVAVGTASDQQFRDDSVGASFFGYYLTTGLRTQGQAGGTRAYIQIRAGAGATANRTYYLLGNGTTTPTLQSHLTIAPASYTSIVNIPRNQTRCGPSYGANGVSGVNGVNCGSNPTVDDMDITQFIKVLFTDTPSTPITSELQFVVSVF